MLLNDVHSDKVLAFKTLCSSWSKAEDENTKVKQPLYNAG